MEFFMRFLLIIIILQLPLFAQYAGNEDRTIDSLLTKWHQSAKIADAENYFGFIKDDGIFMGTDATERWTKSEFMEWSKPYFNRESAWNIYSLNRQIFIHHTNTFAWFDEELYSDLGPARGSGVLLKENDGWKLAHYNLALTIPNEIVTEIKQLVEQELKKQ
jgi:hypothetical protein